MNWDHCSDFGEEDFKMNYLRNQAEIYCKENSTMRMKYKTEWYTCKELFEYAVKRPAYSEISLEIFDIIIMNVKKQN